MSIYPDAIDGYQQLPLIVDGVTPVNAISVNALREAILKVETELGIQPSGSFTTLSERLDALDPGSSDSITDAITNIENRLDVLEAATGNILLTLTTASSLVAGDLVVINASGEATLGNAGTGTVNDSRIVGASTGTFSVSASAQFNSTYGSLIPVRFGVVPAAASNGSPVYLSTSDGLATLTAPDSPGQVVYLVGILQGGDGISSAPEVLFQPKLISEIR